MNEETPRASDTLPSLASEQIRQFIRDGYVVVSGLIPQEVVRETQATLWNALGRREDDPSTWPEDRILVPHEVNALMAPCRTPAFEAVAEQLVGPHFLRGGGFSPVLNFPRPGEKRFQPMGFHIDGIDESTLWPDKRFLVTLIYLTDVSDYGGATAVLPGSHRQLFRHWVSMGTGPEGKTNIPDLPYAAPVAVEGKAGDVIWMHYLLGHGSSENHDGHVRVALNGTVRPDPHHPYLPKKGTSEENWTPLDRTLQTDDGQAEPRSRNPGDKGL